MSALTFLEERWAKDKGRNEGKTRDATFDGTPPLFCRNDIRKQNAWRVAYAIGWEAGRKQKELNIG